jgi:hypothetical protein
MPVADRNTMIQDVARNVPGSISSDACRILYNVIADDLPRDGVVLVLNCGQGRSTIIAGKALAMEDKGDATILAVDTHITNPLASKPHETGSLIPFLTHLRIFKVASRVNPLVSGVSAVTKLLNKKSANVVVVHVPTIHVDFGDALRAGIEAALFSIRTSGKVILFGEGPEFDRLTDESFKSGFKLTTEHPGLRVYTSLKKEEK